MWREVGQRELEEEDSYNERTFIGSPRCRAIRPKERGIRRARLLFFMWLVLAKPREKKGASGVPWPNVVKTQGAS